MPALMGYDADHSMSRGEVGKEGVAVSSLRDFEVLFDGIPLADVTTSMTINATAPIALAMYVAVAEQQGTPRAKLGGTLQNDMLKEYIAQKEWMVPPGPAVKMNCDVIEFCAREMPRWNPVSVSGYHIREAGATAVQELAFTIADGLAYVQECVGRGLDVDAFAQRLSFFWDVHNDFFEEVAKFRAARRMWARLMRDRFKARKTESLLLRTHAQTAGVSLTAQQPINNVVRVALQALRGGAGRHPVAPHQLARRDLRAPHRAGGDGGAAHPADHRPRVGRRPGHRPAGRQLLRRVAHRRDGAAGRRADRARSTSMGGMLKAVENGFPQREIAESAFRWQREVENEERLVVGVNAFQSAEGAPIPTLKVDEEVPGRAGRAAAAGEGRAATPRRSTAALAGVERAAREGSNVMPPIIAAVKAYATLGEISDVCRKVFGVYRDDGRF